MRLPLLSAQEPAASPPFYSEVQERPLLQSRQTPPASHSALYSSAVPPPT